MRFSVNSCSVLEWFGKASVSQVEKKRITERRATGCVSIKEKIVGIGAKEKRRQKEKKKKRNRKIDRWALIRRGAPEKVTLRSEPPGKKKRRSVRLYETDNVEPVRKKQKRKECIRSNRTAGQKESPCEPTPKDDFGGKPRKEESQASNGGKGLGKMSEMKEETPKPRPLRNERGRCHSDGRRGAVKENEMVKEIVRSSENKCGGLRGAKKGVHLRREREKKKGTRANSP